MKIFVAIVILFSFLGYENSFAQRHMKNEMALSIYGGIPINRLNTFDGANNHNLPFVVGADWVKFRKNESYWKISVDYAKRSGSNKPVESYLAALDYGFNFLETRRRGFYLSPLVGLFLGYEKGFLPSDSLKQSMGELLTLKENFVIGPQVGLESEFYFDNSSCIILGVRMRYSPFAVDDAKFHPAAYLGLRFGFFKGL